MIDITDKIYRRVKAIIDTWNEPDIYAISFFVYSNEAYEYKGFRNVSSFAVSFNAESDCDGAGEYSEERWNYAFWRQDEFPVIEPSQPDTLTELLFAWYSENGITDIGKEADDCYDSEGYYIGKGPCGHYELLSVVSDAARRIQEEGFIEGHFGRKLPIIVHGLDYAWYDIEATKNANPNGEAEVFMKAMKKLGFI